MSELATQYRTHTCGDLRAGDDGAEATLCGHADRRLDDRRFLVRDRYGKTLVTVHDEALPYVPERFAALNPEDVVQVAGVVALRDEKDRDKDLETGEVQLRARTIEVLSPAATLPPGVLDAKTVPPDDRNAFRQLYLRRPEMQARLELRSRVAQAIREYLVAEGFYEIETPHLFWYDRVALASEPIPVGGGKAFALPSGGLVLDQYIIAGQFERFFQFLRVTRRELRAVTPMHAPEHTLLDLNLAYVDVPDFCAVVERLLAHVFRAVLGVELATPFPSFTYHEALEKFGTDKPDLRLGLDIEEVPGAAAGSGARRIRVPGGAAKLKEYELAKLTAEGARAGVHVSFRRVETGGPDGRPGDLVATFESPKNPGAAAVAAGAARRTLAARVGPLESGTHAPCWITSYPYLTDDRGTLVPAVAVFSQPRGSAMADFADHPEARDKLLASAFDLVIDGVEVASAYIGNHDLRTQRFVWDEVLKFSTPDLVRVRAPIESHRFGVPPHGGMNIGFDRLVALLLGLEAIDEAMPFPKTPDCRDLLLDAPAPVPPEAVKDIVGAESPPADVADRQLVEETLKL